MNPDNSRPFPTLPGLSPAQEKALDWLAAGTTQAQAAAAAGVTRPTVTEWNGTPAFQAALRCRRAELWADLRGRLTGAAAKAVSALEAALEDPNPRWRLEAAKALLALVEMPRPDHGEVVTAEDLEEREAQAAATKARSRADRAEAEHREARRREMKAAGKSALDIILLEAEGKL